MSSNSDKAILFLGATGGCALTALRESLEAGYTCVALCRTPSKLTEKLGSAVVAQHKATLRVEQGNAHDVAALQRALMHSGKPGHLVDVVISSIGASFQLSGMTIDDPHVCEKGINALLEALTAARTSVGTASKGHPRIVVVSSAGFSRYGRDMSLLAQPLNMMLKVPHADKIAMEDAVTASQEAWTIVRPTLLRDGGGVASHKTVRVGVEDPIAGKVEKREVGLSITREDVGRWMFANLIDQDEAGYLRKTATLTY